MLTVFYGANKPNQNPLLLKFIIYHINAIPRAVRRALLKCTYVCVCVCVKAHVEERAPSASDAKQNFN